MSRLLLLPAGIKGGGWCYGRTVRAPVEVRDVRFARIALLGRRAPPSFNA